MFTEIRLLGKPGKIYNPIGLQKHRWTHSLFIYSFNKQCIEYLLDVRNEPGISDQLMDKMVMGPVLLALGTMGGAHT